MLSTLKLADKFKPRTIRIYGVHMNQLSNYHLVADSSRSGQEIIAAEIIRHLERWQAGGVSQNNKRREANNNDALCGFRKSFDRLP